MALNDSMRSARSRFLAWLSECSSAASLPGQWTLEGQGAELTYQDATCCLHLQLGPADPRAWFFEAAAPVSILAYPPDGDDPEPGRRVLRRLREALDGARESFVDVTRDIQLGASPTRDPAGDGPRASEALLTALLPPGEQSDAEREALLRDWLTAVSADADLTGEWSVAVAFGGAELSYREAGFQLRFQLSEAHERAWFVIPGTGMALYADPPDGREANPDGGRDALRRLHERLSADASALVNVARQIYSPRYVGEDMSWFSADVVPDEINRAAYHLLRVIERGARMEPVRRPGDEQWYSASSAELYPWVAASGDPIEWASIEAGWRRYAGRWREYGMPLSLYIHIPFCARICSFCHCARLPIDGAAQLSRYVDVLLDEIRGWGEILGDVPLTTLYVGGGTPSVLTPADLSRLLQTVADTFAFAEDFQFSIEANPDSLTREKLDAICSAIPLDRLSMGIQTLDPAAQALANRYNAPERIARLVEHARSLGVKVVHFDLIAGLDGLHYESFKTDLETAARYGPETVKVYGYRPFRFGGDDLEVVVDPDVITRRRTQVRWAERFLRRTHARGLGVSAEAVRAQRNLQIDYTYEHSSAMLSLGVSGISYIPREMYYEVPEGLGAWLAGPKSLRYPAVPTDEQGDCHGTLVKSIQMDIGLGQLEATYGTDGVLAALERWPLLNQLGIWLHDGRIVSRTTSVTKLYLAKYFVASPTVRERFSKRFDPLYDEQTNYFASLARLLDGEIMQDLGRLTA